MREIKFRVRASHDIWTDERTRIEKGEWIYYYPETFPIMWKDKLDLDTRSQYTGLKDKNGKEIYEGDIVNYRAVKTHPHKCKIIYEPDAAAFLLNDISGASVDYAGIKYLGSIVKNYGSSVVRAFELCEVIGNIMENPELLR